METAVGDDVDNDVDVDVDVDNDVDGNMNNEASASARVSVRSSARPSTELILLRRLRIEECLSKAPHLHKGPFLIGWRDRTFNR